MMHPSRFTVAIILHLLLSFQCARGYKQVTFYMQREKGLPDTPDVTDTLQASTAIGCARSCRNSPECFSFYAERKDNSWTCQLIHDRFIESNIPSGIGVFGGIFGFVEEELTAPSIIGADFLFENYDLHSGGDFAVYDCSKTNTMMTTVGIMYDDVNDEWPSLSPECQQSLCHQVGLSASILHITEQVVLSDTKYVIQVKCPGTDTHWSDAECDHLGIWTLEDDSVGAACVASNCFRYDMDGRAVYDGDLSQSILGDTCQNWTFYSDKYSDFPVENHVVANASNFCRDSDSSGFPWCFVNLEYNWEECDVTPCSWPFEI